MDLILHFFFTIEFVNSYQLQSNIVLLCVISSSHKLLHYSLLSLLLTTVAHFPHSLCCFDASKSFDQDVPLISPLLSHFVFLVTNIVCSLSRHLFPPRLHFSKPLPISSIALILPSSSSTLAISFQLLINILFFKMQFNSIYSFNLPPFPPPLHFSKPLPISTFTLIVSSSSSTLAIKF